MERASLKSIIRGTKNELIKEMYIFPNTIVFLELDTGKIKFADGKKAYKDIDYVTGKTDPDAGIFRYKGQKDTIQDLEAITDQENGDCWDIKENGHNYIWNGSEWDDLGGTFDTSNLVKKDEFELFEEEINGSIESINISLEQKANKSNVYTKTEIDTTFANYSTTSEIENVLNNTEEAILHEVDTKLEDYQSNEAAGEMKAELEEEISHKIDSDVIEAELADQVAALTQQINDLKLLIPTETFTADEVRNATKKSGKVTLCEDVDLGNISLIDGTFANNITTINLNGHTLSASPTGSRPLLKLRGTSQYTFNGNGIVEDFANDSSCVWSSTKDNICTINGGTWICQGHTETIYCELGTIYINGGEFKTGSEDKRYLLNCKDANYQSGKANIIVKGGKFWDFDPHNNTAEGANTNFCAAGYTTTSEEIDGHTVYTVIKE